MPHLSLFEPYNPFEHSPFRRAVGCARRRYWTAKIAESEKSGIVRGFASASRGALMYQCADTARIARGRGMDSPNARHASVYRFWSSVFIGEPWPKNTAGILRFAIARPK